MDYTDKTKKRGSIKSGLIAMFAVLIIIPIVILGIYAYIVAKNNLIEQTRITMIGNADVISYGIENNEQSLNTSVLFDSDKGRDDMFVFGSFVLFRKNIVPLYLPYN